MKLGILILLAVSFSSFSANAKTKSFTYSVEAGTEELLMEIVKEKLSVVKVGEKADPFGCSPVTPVEVNISNVSISKKYSVDSEENLTPYYVGNINYTQKFKCRDGGN